VNEQQCCSPNSTDIKYNPLISIHVTLDSYFVWIPRRVQIMQKMPKHSQSWLIIQQYFALRCPQPEDLILNLF